MVVEYPATHAMLIPLLPVLADLLHDTSESVRFAFVDLLVNLKEIKGVHFYDIVPVDQLLTRLVVDKSHASLSGRLTELLSNSFYPRGPGSSRSVFYFYLLTY